MTDSNIDSIIDLIKNTYGKNDSSVYKHTLSKREIKKLKIDPNKAVIDEPIREYLVNIDDAKVQSIKESITNVNKYISELEPLSLIPEFHTSLKSLENTNEFIVVLSELAVPENNIHAFNCGSINNGKMIISYELLTDVLYSDEYTEYNDFGDIKLDITDLNMSIQPINTIINLSQLLSTDIKKDNNTKTFTKESNSGMIIYSKQNLDFITSKMHEFTERVQNILKQTVWSIFFETIVDISKSVKGLLLTQLCNEYSSNELNQSLYDTLQSFDELNNTLNFLQTTSYEMKEVTYDCMDAYNIIRMRRRGKPIYFDDDNYTDDNYTDDEPDETDNYDIDDLDIDDSTETKEYTDSEKAKLAEYAKAYNTYDENIEEDTESSLTTDNTDKQDDSYSPFNTKETIDDIFSRAVIMDDSNYKSRKQVAHEQWKRVFVKNLMNFLYKIDNMLNSEQGNSKRKLNLESIISLKDEINTLENKAEYLLNELR